MKAMLLMIAAFASSVAHGADYVVVQAGPTSVQRTTSSATLTPSGVYWTFSSPRATTTLGPRGELYQTFRGVNSTVTLLPQGQMVFTVRGR